MPKRGPLAATDRRRQAGHKHVRRLGGEDEESRERNGAGKSIAHLFNDRRQRLGEGKRTT